MTTANHRPCKAQEEQSKTTPGIALGESYKSLIERSKLFLEPLCTGKRHQPQKKSLKSVPFAMRGGR